MIHVRIGKHPAFVVRKICKTKQLPTPMLLVGNQEMLKDEGGTIQADQGSSL